MPDYICFLSRIQITKLNNGLKQTDFLYKFVLSSANDVHTAEFRFFPLFSWHLGNTQSMNHHPLPHIHIRILPFERFDANFNNFFID